MNRKLLLLSGSALLLGSATITNAETFNVSTTEELRNAAAIGGTINLMNDVNIGYNLTNHPSKPGVIGTDVLVFQHDTTIDGNGHALTGQGFTYPNWVDSNSFAFIRVNDGKFNVNNLTIKDFNTTDVSWRGAIIDLYGKASSDIIDLNVKDNRLGGPALAISTGVQAGDVKMTFTNNQLNPTASQQIYLKGANGFALFNDGNINTLKGTFENNTLDVTRSAVGLIENQGKGSIQEVDIIARNNFLSGTYEKDEYGDANGGVMSNHGKLGTFKGTFENNGTKAVNATAHGGAFDMERGTVELVDGSFSGNHVESNLRAHGGAASVSLSDNAKIDYLDTIRGTFNENYAKTDSGWASGGAISVSEGKVRNIYGTFDGNSAIATDRGYAYGGAISTKRIYPTDNNYPAGSIDKIEATFTNNYVTATDNINHNNTSLLGGAIYNAEEATIGQIVNSTFTGNKAFSSDYLTIGGAIANEGTIGNISADFNKNSADIAGAIYNGGTIGDITGKFDSNFASDVGYYFSSAGIINGGTIKNISGEFVNNYTTSLSAFASGAIANYAEIGDINADFSGNFVHIVWEEDPYYATGGAIANVGEVFGSSFSSKIGDIHGQFTNNYVRWDNGTAMGGAIFNSGAINNLVNSNFTGNYAIGNADSNGGAIYSATDLKITAQDGGTSKFTGNYVIADGVKTNNAIYMSDGNLLDETFEQKPTLTLNALTNGQILFNDEIDGVEGYKIALTGDSTGTVTFNNNIRNADITLEKTNVNLGDVKYLNNNNDLTINSGKFNVAHLGLNDQLTANSIALNGGVLNIAELDVDLAAKKMGTIDGSKLTQNGGSVNVEKMLVQTDTEDEVTAIEFVSGNQDINVTHNDKQVEKVIAPMYRYNVSYNNGEFTFVRDGFNPGVFANDVAAMSGLNMQGEVAKQVFDMDTNREYCNGRVWATPYYSDDTLGFSDFYDVDSKNYGLIAGIDTRAFGDYDGWNSVYTLFGAYNDGESEYQGVKVDSKSWLVGLKASVYNGGFYGDAIINYAWHDSDQKTAFGTDSVDSTGYGAALKAGYKHGFDRVELDTSAMLSWQTIEGDDFTSKSSARISTDDYSRLTLTPQVKLGYSFEKVKPYALVRYNFVLDEDGSSTVNNISLPTIESKDYVEYGLGVETTDAFPHGGFAHVLRHDGGRDGWSVTAGYKYNF